ncbi:MAG: ABC transporter permease [Firmicutes bacterium]|nr:ABC transporter permease [Bacillota bacterium]
MTSSDRHAGAARLGAEVRRAGAGLPALKFREVNILAALVLISLFFYWRNPVFLTPENLGIIFRWMAVFALLGIGETFVIVSGGIDLSPGSMVALTNMVAAWLMVKVGVSMRLSLLAVLLLSLAVGAWHGLFVTKLGVPAFIITLGTLMWARGLAAYITKGWIISGVPQEYLVFGQGEVLGIPVQFLILLVVALVAAFVLDHTVLGRHIYAVGGNIEAARVTGVNVDRVRMFCYLASATAAGITGIITGSRLGEGNPAVGVAYELWAIAAAVIGGTSLFGGEGSVLGVLLGAAIMGVVVNGLVLVGVSAYLQDVVLGLILVVAVTMDTRRRRRMR